MALIDDQHVFNFVVAIAGFLAAFVFNHMTRKITKLEDKVESIQREYVHKDDYRADIKDIKDILQQIFDRLDNKADKH